MSNKIVAIIPTFNRGHLISETIESLLSQTRIPEVIHVYDDGSTDNTREVLSAFGDQIVATSQDNKGKAATLNAALASIEADYVWICDDDDILRPEACELLAGELDVNSETAFVAGRHTDFTTGADLKDRKLKPPGYWRHSSPHEIFPDLLEGCHIFQPGLLVRKSAYDEIGSFNTDLVRSQDYEMILRLARRFAGKILDKEVFLHREHEGLRGTAAAQFSADSMADKWAEFNRAIFEPLLEDLEDEEFFSHELWASTPPHLRPRLVLLKKACVSARQRMWDHATHYWTLASECSDAPMTPAEVDLIKRSLTSSLGTPELIADANVQNSIKSIARKSGTGKVIVNLLQRHSRWKLKNALLSGRFGEAVGAARFLMPVASA